MPFNTPDEENYYVPDFNYASGASVKQDLSSAYHFFISGEIGNDETSKSLIKTLKSCGSQDIVSIYLNTMGGDMYTTMQIINSIRSCAGRVATHADGLVASAGSLIFFAGDMMSVSELSSFLLHNGSGGVGGKMSDVHAHSDHTRSLIHKVFHSVYEPFFTPDEVDKILQGQDMYLHAEQVMGRISKVCETSEENNNNENDESVPQAEPKARKTRKVPAKK